MTKRKKLEAFAKNNPATAERIYSMAYEMIYEPDLLFLAELSKKTADEKGTKFYSQLISYVKRFSK